MTQDAELLRRYSAEGSEADFADLTRRHVDLVYSAALRLVQGDVHSAQDVTQQVFTEVARQANRLARHPALVGWLYTTTAAALAALVSANAVQAAPAGFAAALSGAAIAGSALHASTLIAVTKTIAILKSGFGRGGPGYGSPVARIAGRDGLCPVQRIQRGIAGPGHPESAQRTIGGDLAQ